MADPSLLNIPRIPATDDPQSGTDTATDLRTIERWGRYLRDSVWPVGIMRPIATATPNVDWLICDGSAVPRLQYVTLFNKIGTTYGVGDGTSTFNIPDCRGRVLLGAGTASGGTVNRVLGSSGGAEGITAANMPSHQHTTPSHLHGLSASKFTGAAAHTHAGVGGGIAENGNPTDGGSNPFASTDTTAGGLTTATGTGTAYSPPFVTVNYEIRAV
jgi:microcystin-dependent protein